MCRGGRKYFLLKRIDIENRAKLFLWHGLCLWKTPRIPEALVSASRTDVCQKPQAPVTECLTYPCKQTTKVTSF